MNRSQIEVIRHTDAERINIVLNHPSVRPWVSDEKGEINLQSQLDNKANILLMGEHGGILFLNVMPGVYEAHTQVLPEGRGEWTDNLTHSCIHWMFTKTDCYELITRVPRPHTRAKAAAIRSGGKYEFSRDDGCLFLGKIVPVDLYTIRIQDWCVGGQFLETIGSKFHEKLHAEAARFEIREPAHDDDSNHNYVVGAVYEMMKHGQLMKGVNIYNRWAIISRHTPITLVSVEPPTIKMDIGFLKMINNDIELSI